MSQHSYRYRKLTKARLQLPEYNKFQNSFFEIQVRTILQHAWAEIEHDRNYKFSGELPPEIKRRFKLLAGNLELADIEFDRLADEIDKYVKSVETNTKKGNLNIEINSTSLKQYLSTKFSKVIKQEDFKQNFADRDLQILEEIKLFGLKSLEEFDKIIPKDFEDKLLGIEGFAYKNFLGLTRGILIAVDYKKYFEKCWSKDKWGGFAAGTQKILEAYNVPVKDIAEKYKLKIVGKK